jgi:uncharacterized protein YxjI
MRYQMKQKLFSFGDDFHIKDGDGNHAATVDGKVFSIGDKLSFLNPSGKELVRIELTLFADR